jgi:hypothetical protein
MAAASRRDDGGRNLFPRPVVHDEVVLTHDARRETPMIKAARILCALVLAALVVPSGCMQVEQGTTLFPDGSGKITMKIAIKKSMLKMIEGFAKQFQPEADPDKKVDPLEDLTNPESLAKNSEGVGAWKIGKKEEDADWIRMTNVGYFEDVNKVKIYQAQQPQPGGPAGERTLAFAAKFEKTADGYVLTMKDDTRKELQQLPGAGGPPGGGNEELGKAVLEMMKPMLQDLKVALSITVPGPIQEAQGFISKKDRTATIAFDGDMMLDVIANPEGEKAKKLKSLAESKEGRITWAENKVSEEEVAAFRKEMEGAKEGWAKALEEAKKKSTKE